MPSYPQYKDNFAISADGVITATGELNREVKANYSFEVRAMDLDPDHPRYNATVVEIEVLDTNDNPPVFRQASYVADLPEHSDVGYIALQVSYCGWHIRLYVLREIYLTDWLMTFSIIAVFAL